MKNLSSSSSPSSQNWGPMGIAGIYLFVGSSWILFSDRAASKIAPDQATLATISLYKGWGYVLVTALLLYWMIHRYAFALQRGKDQLQLVTDALPVLISYVDSDKQYRLNNKAYEDWFGHSRTDIYGRHLKKVLGISAYQVISKHVDLALTGKVATYEADLPYQNGGPRFVNATYIPDVTKGGKVQGFFALVQDITERKKSDEELRKWANAFEGCAHGIAICDPIANRILAALDEEGRRVCGVINGEVHRLEQLINDLLSFSRLSRKEVHSKKIDMYELANSVFRGLVNDNERQRIEFEITKLPDIMGDEPLMRQVWTNLLSNAVKFTSGRKRAVIEVGSRQNKDETIYHIRDNGAGFDMDYADKLFGIFQRLHSEGEFEGTGVGLAIVQRVIHRHGGRVWAEGEVDKGATFYFALPQKRETV